MKIYDEILTWVKTQEPLVGEVFRRIVLHNGYSLEDVLEVVTLLKQDEGVSDPPKKLEQPSFPQHDQVSVSAESQKLIIKRIQSFKDVSTIEDGSSVPFAHDGLTIVYGENGAGKTGVARILKQVGRAKRVEKVLSNVFSGAQTISKGEIVYSKDHTDKTTEWQDGKHALDDLSNISVFDSRSALAQIDNRSELFFTPKGAEIFEQIASFFLAIKDALNKEFVTATPPLFTTLITTPNELSATLSKIQDLKEFSAVENLIHWTDVDDLSLKNQAELSAACDTKVNAQKQAVVDQHIKKIDDVLQYISYASQVFSEDKLQSLEYIGNKLVLKRTALEALAKQLKDDASLPVGTAVWRELYLAAKKYSTEQGYPDKKFPFVESSDSVCVLCQQPFVESSNKRMKAFELFMEGEIKKELDEATGTYNRARTFIQEQLIDGYSVASTQLNELVVIHIELNNEQLDGLRSWAENLDQELALFGDRETEATNVLTRNYYQTGLKEKLVTLKEQLTKSKEDLKAVLDPTKSKQVNQELQAMQYRKEAFGRKAEIQKYVEDSIRNRKLSQCLKRVSTTAITKSGNKIVSSHVSKVFVERLSKEIGQLGARTLPIKIEMSGETGSVVFELALENASMPKSTHLSDVLSEGEVKVICLAAFLAETSLESGTRYPIVLDDPVTSLDHRYRERIAERLTIEGIERQVIVCRISKMGASRFPSWEPPPERSDDS